MRIDWVSHPGALHALEPAWRELEAAVATRPHLSSFDFLYPWYTRYAGPYGGTPLIGLAWRGRERDDLLANLQAVRSDGPPAAVVAGHELLGDDALEADRELRPDLVLVDVGLPDCDGRDLAARLGAEPHVMVLLISSRDDVESDGEALGFIPKDRLSAEAITELLP